MICGLLLLIPGAALLVLAQAWQSMPLLLTASALTGCAIALGYRGSLQVVNAIAPAEQRAEVVSSYFIAGFLGNSVPVIGLGVISTVWDTLVASGALGVTVVGFAIVALLAGTRYPVDSETIVKKAA